MLSIMKWLFTFLIILLLAFGGYLMVAKFTGGQLPTFGINVGKDKYQVRDVTLAFWEDIKFKDIESASKVLHADKQNKEEILNFLSKIFGTSPANLDLISYEIEKLELDSTGKRARVKVTATAQHLQKQEDLEDIKVNVMLFFRQHAEDQKWFLEIDHSF